MIKFIKPIVFFDLETTGTKPATDRIVQIASIKIMPDGEREEKMYLIDPGIVIPEEATAIHGITNEMVNGQPQFRQIAKALLAYMFGCDLGGYRSNDFDIPLLMEEFGRVGIEFPTWELTPLDVYQYEIKKNTNKLVDVYRRYTGMELDDAHDALADIRATLVVLEHQTAGEEEFTPDTIDSFCQQDKRRFDLAGKCYIADGVVYWSFGKNQDKPVLADLKYLEWVLNADFPSQTRKKLMELLTKKK